MTAKQMVFVFDQAKCVGCQSCEVNCKVVNKNPVGVKYRKVISTAYTGTSIGLRPHLSVSCNHCSDPVCIRACPAVAYSKREKDGVVVQDPDRCIGCQYCVLSCPYNAPQFNEETEKAQKCDFCLERVEQGILPGCIEGCPAQALTFGELSDIGAKYPDLKTLPNLMDANPYLFVKESGRLHAGAASTGGYTGDIADYLTAKAGTHWWEKIMRPAGKVVLGAAAVVVGATAIKGAVTKGEKEHEE